MSWILAAKVGNLLIHFSVLKQCELLKKKSFFFVTTVMLMILMITMMITTDVDDRYDDNDNYDSDDYNDIGFDKE